MGGTPTVPMTGARMPAPVIAATDPEPCAMRSTAATSQASSTGMPALAWNRAPSMSPMPTSVMTLPREPATPVNSRIEPEVCAPRVMISSTPLRVTCGMVSTMPMSRPMSSATTGLPRNSIAAGDCPSARRETVSTMISRIGTMIGIIASTIGSWCCRVRSSCSASAASCAIAASTTLISPCGPCVVWAGSRCSGCPSATPPKETWSVGVWV